MCIWVTVSEGVLELFPLDSTLDSTCFASVWLDISSKAPELLVHLFIGCMDSLPASHSKSHDYGRCLSAGKMGEGLWVTDGLQGVVYHLQPRRGSSTTNRARLAINACLLSTYTDTIEVWTIYYDGLNGSIPWTTSLLCCHTSYSMQRGPGTKRSYQRSTVKWESVGVVRHECGVGRGSTAGRETSSYLSTIHLLAEFLFLMTNSFSQEKTSLFH